MSRQSCWVYYWESQSVELKVVQSENKKVLKRDLVWEWKREKSGSSRPASRGQARLGSRGARLGLEVGVPG